MDCGVDCDISNYYIVHNHAGELEKLIRKQEYLVKTYITKISESMGFAACRNEGHYPPPQFSFGGPTMVLAPHPQFWEVYNNSNLVNNVVFKKLTTKLASMKYHIYYGNYVWYHLLNFLTQLLDFLLYIITVYSQ